MKILIIGHGQHGKDTTAEIIQEEFGLSFRASSEAALDIFMFDILQKRHGYKNKQEAIDHKNQSKAIRKEWHDLITEYNINIPSRLASKILALNDIYVGMRSNREFEDCQKRKMFDLVLGVFDHRKPTESKESFNIDFFKASQIIIPNTGTLKDLRHRVKLLHALFTGKEKPKMAESTG